MACSIQLSVLPTAGAQQMSFRLLGSDFTFWKNISHFMPSATDPNAQVLVFDTPPYFPSGFDGPTNSTEFWTGPPWVVGTSFPDDPDSSNEWPNLTNYNFTSTACGGDITNDVAGANVMVRTSDCFWPMSPDSTPDDALQVALAWWNTNNPGVSEPFATIDCGVTMKIQGGKYDGHNVTLPAAIASAAVLTPLSTPHDQHAIGVMFLAVDWGIDVVTNHEFLIFYMYLSCDAWGGALCLSLPSYCQQWLGAPRRAVLRAGLVEQYSRAAFRRKRIPSGRRARLFVLL